MIPPEPKQDRSFAMNRCKKKILAQKKEGKNWKVFTQRGPGSNPFPLETSAIIVKERLKPPTSVGLFKPPECQETFSFKTTKYKKTQQERSFYSEV